MIETQQIDWKTIVRETLDLLSSEAEQLAYERNVPLFDITNELIASWFSDSYHPDTPSFNERFSVDELSALAEFNTLFETQMPLLPPSAGTVRTWLASPAWRRVMEAAGEARRCVVA